MIKNVAHAQVRESPAKCAILCVVAPMVNAHLIAAAGSTAADPATGVGVLAAVAAGLVSFLSPCVLPLVPGYLSAVIGVTPAELDRVSTRRVLVPSLLFVASFSLIFVLLGLGATAIGSTLQDHRQALERAGAIVIIVLGVFFLLTPAIVGLNREWHPQRLMRVAGRGGPLLAGAAFALAWTPCVGPTLSVILSQAAISSSASHAAVLLAFYSAGLAIPFLATALAFGRMTSVFARVKRHFPLIIGAGGVVLVAMGVLILTGEFTILNAKANSLLQGTGLNFATNI
jgi:cytochrome c-type biogenesis protein